LRPRIGHVGRGIKPVFEEEEKAEDEPGGLTVGEEIRRQQKRHQPLQQRPSPYTEGWSEPHEKIVAAFVDYQVGQVNEEHAAVSLECVDQETGIEDEPAHLCRPRHGLPWPIKNRLEYRSQKIDHK
jgi:hypothetical protein